MKQPNVRNRKWFAEHPSTGHYSTPYDLNYQPLATRELLAMRAYLVHGRKPETLERLSAINRHLAARHQPPATSR